MKDLVELNVLMDKAKAIAGSDASIARAIGVVPQRIANWRNGSAGCSLEDRALIAVVAGLDPLREMARAAVRKHEGTEKGDRLMKALGKSLLATGAAIASAGATAASIFSTIQAPSHLVDAIVRFTQCALC